MLRMGKLTDYGIVMMSHFASNLQVQHSAHAIAEAVKVPLPTVRKVLKLLSHSGLLKSERGAMGGYSLSRQPDDITVAEIITAIEGPIALTECVSTDSHCDQETHCAVQTNWSKINDAVFHALDEVKLSDMLSPQSSLGFSPIRFYSSYNRMHETTLQDGEFHD
ncbi:transcriptional regulator, BadM/Rrf2 family [Methylophaga sulfidovorans]|uniref:Transcriptional regulator, BadM/Rrf2 family n=2 Tax=Methylophaga sulfidovorans TaxID=45496 RepID=A0A1I3VLC4_9GAMM|nr:transcriptional regulator, BadM/Rrf2 family [Methylophaga sulfidovorans]